MRKSVVSCEKIGGGVWTIGEVSNIKTSGGVYKGMVTATQYWYVEFIQSY